MTKPVMWYYIYERPSEWDGTNADKGRVLAEQELTKEAAIEEASRTLAQRYIDDADGPTSFDDVVDCILVTEFGDGDQTETPIQVAYEVDADMFSGNDNAEHSTMYKGMGW